MIPGGGTRQAQAQDATGPPQEIAGTLPNDFTLANTKAEVKGGDHEPVYVSNNLIFSFSFLWRVLDGSFLISACPASTVA